MADHLSRLENPHLAELRYEDIDDNFPDETLMNVSSTEEDKIPWADNSKDLDECHHGTTGGHLWSFHLRQRKFSDAGFYGPKNFQRGPYSSSKLDASTFWLPFTKRRDASKQIHVSDTFQIYVSINGDHSHLKEKQKMEAIPLMAPFPADYRETMPWVVKIPFIYNVVENTCNEAKLYDLDETNEGIVTGNFFYVKKDLSKKSSLREK
ncbi:hypothetical protein Tco_0421217 [Tanacetum coccineum]